MGVSAVNPRAITASAMLAGNLSNAKDIRVGHPSSPRSHCPAIFRRSAELRGKAFEISRELDVFVGHAARVVSHQIDDHLVPNVEPLRSVVHRFDRDGRRGHEAEGVHEIFELILAMKLAVDQLPTLERSARQMLLDLFRAQLLLHDHELPYTGIAAPLMSRASSDNKFTITRAIDSGFTHFE